MAKKNFVLVSLGEKKAKKLAEVISNNTCRKILDHMTSTKDVTETELSKELKKPLSTIHYNMKALMDAKLVKCDEYHYSKKGKEINHYRLANQYVIIAPEGEKEGIREKLKSLLPVALVIGGLSFVIKLFSGMGIGTTSNDAVFTSKSLAAPMIAQESAEIAGGAMAKVAPMRAMAEPVADMAVAEVANEAMVETANMVVEEVSVEAVHYGGNLANDVIVQTSNTPEIALWFAIGAISGIGIYLLVDFIRKKISK